MKNQIIKNWESLPLIMDTKLVARAFNVSPATIKNWIYQGKLKPMKRLGRGHRFDKAYIMRLVEGEDSDCG